VNVRLKNPQGTPYGLKVTVNSATMGLLVYCSSFMDSSCVVKRVDDIFTLVLVGLLGPLRKSNCAKCIPGNNTPSEVMLFDNYSGQANPLCPSV